MTSGATTRSVHASAAAAGSLASDSSKEGIADPQAELLLLDLIKPEKKKAPAPTKSKRLFGMTTLAALRQRPQLPSLRQKEAKLSTVKAEELRGSPPPTVPSVSEDTAGPSNAPLDTPLCSTDMAAGSAAQPSPAVASTSSGWNLAQSQGANQAQHEDHSMPPQQLSKAASGETTTQQSHLSDSAGPPPSASVTDEATAPVDFPVKPQPKLSQKERRAQTGGRAAVDDDSAGPSTSAVAGATSPAAAPASPASYNEATANELSTAQATQRTQQQAQQSAGGDLTWGTISPMSPAPANQLADESFPPLSQARQRRPRPIAHPAPGLAADTAGPSVHAGTAELSFGDFAAGTSPTAEGVRAPRPDQTRSDNGLGATVEPSRQAQHAEVRAASPQQAEADAAPSRADSSIPASSSASLTDASAATLAEPAAAIPAVGLGQRIAGRGPFQLSNELQMALSGKPKPGRGRGKAALPLPEPSADLVLQRALMEKPKPRPRPRRPPVTPQSTGIVSCTVFTGSAFCLAIHETDPRLRRVLLPQHQWHLYSRANMHLAIFGLYHAPRFHAICASGLEIRHCPFSN